MEYFTASCLCRGEVSIDGISQGENKVGDTPRIFCCCAGLHDITLDYRGDGACQRQTKRVMITGTTPILPLAIPFICEL